MSLDATAAAVSPNAEFRAPCPRTLRHSPVAMSHILMVLSREPVMIFFLKPTISTAGLEGKHVFGGRHTRQIAHSKRYLCVLSNIWQ